MKKLLKKVSFIGLLSLMVISAFPTKIQALDVVKQEIGGRGYQEVEDLGNAAFSVAVTSAVFGEIDGVTMAFTVANGGTLNVVDVESNKLVHSVKVDLKTVWTHQLTTDGILYMAGLDDGDDGQLYAYNTKTKEVIKYGTIDITHQFWSSALDEENNLYIGTYKSGSNGSVFKFDHKTKEMTNLGVVMPGAEADYVRSMAYHDGHLYLGIGTHARIVKMNLETGEKTDISEGAHKAYLGIKQSEELNQEVPLIKFAYDMAIINDLLIARLDSDLANQLVFFDLEKQEWSDITYRKDLSVKDDPNNQGAFGWNTLQEINGKTYITFNYALHELDLETLALTPVKDANGNNVPLKVGFRGFGVIDGKHFVTIIRAGNPVIFNTETKTLIQKDIVMQATPLALHNLNKDNNGDIYVTTYPGGPRGAKYDISEEAFISYPSGQAEGIVAGNGNIVYFGMYPGAYIQEMNTETQELKTIFELKTDYGQDRPYVMEFIDGLLLIGTIPDYGKHGGVLSIYNPETSELKTYTDIVKDQSIVGITKIGNKIIGSTTIHGGLQTTPVADEAALFLFDMETEKVVKTATLNIPGLGKTPHISGLTTDANGTVWGIADGIIFTLNPETLEVIDYKDVYPNVRNYGFWRPMNIEFDSKGLLYANIGGQVTIIDPTTENWDHIKIETAAVQFFTLSKTSDGTEAIYILPDTATNVLRVQITDDYAVERLPETVNNYVEVPNGSFEDGLNHWTVGFAADTTKLTATQVNDKATDGEHSMKVVDPLTTDTIFVSSDKISVTAGEHYYVEFDLNVADGAASMFLRFFNDKGAQTHKDKDGENIILTNGSDKGWVKVSANMVAPEGSTYAVIGLGVSKIKTTTGAYFDNVKLFTKEIITPEQQVVAELEVLVEEILAEIESGELEESKYTADSWARFIQALDRVQELLAQFNGVTRMARVATPSLMDLEEALSELEKARAALVPVSEVAPEPAPETPEEPGNGGSEVEPNTPTLPSTGIASTTGIATAFLVVGGLLFSRKKED